MLSKNSRPLVAEFLGTFVLASAVLHASNPFITLAILVVLIGGVSGAHLNPAVSLGLASLKKISYDTMYRYWAVQVLGAVVARVLYQYLGNFDIDLGYKLMDPALTARGFVAEAVGTALLVAGITIAIQKKLDGLTLGAAIGGALMIGAFFGGGLNPALAFIWTDVSLAPIIGAFVGGIVGAHFAKELVEGSK